MKSGITRKQLLAGRLTAAASSLAPECLKQKVEAATMESITPEDLKSAEKIAGLNFSDAERAAALEEVNTFPKLWEGLREPPIPYSVEPPTIFTPLDKGSHASTSVSVQKTVRRKLNGSRMTPEQIAFLSVRDLAQLIRTRQISSVALTEIYLDRLKQYGDRLLCVITLTEEKALRKADRADQEIADGRYRGPLHGIPYGIKDLFATRGLPTTWGAAPYAHQQFDYDAAVVERLEAAGAVLIAKLSMGALAQDDIWFRGQTKNPWNPTQGSSGSSAGSAAAMAAGLVAFSIGTETLGSIVSPSHVCRVTGLRPTYGRISRYGAMGLSYTMDKIGPICRDVEDCALVFAAICGADPRDRASVSRSFRWRPRLKRGLKIGYLIAPDADLADRSRQVMDPILTAFAARGDEVRPVRFTPPADGMLTILTVEAASAFDAFTRGPEIQLLHDSNWPDNFRASRHIPAVEYVQAQRARAIMMQRFEDEFGDLDLFVSHGIGEYTLALTNYTGHPQVIIPQGVDDKGESLSMSFTGRLYQEDVLLDAARFTQNLTDFHFKYPDMSQV